MTPPPDLSRLTEAQKDALILALWQQVQDLSTRVAELEAALGGPPKTPENSSLPPSQGRKTNKPPGKDRDGKTRGKGHGRGGRGLHRDPDQRVEARVTACPHSQSWKRFLRNHADGIAWLALGFCGTLSFEESQRCGQECTVSSG